MCVARAFKYGMRIDCQANKPKGVWPTSRDLLLEFQDTLCISEMGKVRNVKFGARIDRQA